MYRFREVVPNGLRERKKIVKDGCIALDVDIEEGASNSAVLRTLRSCKNYQLFFHKV